MVAVKLALIQSKVNGDKQNNIDVASEMIRTAVETFSAKIVILPECFNSPYGLEFSSEYAEEIPSGITSVTLSSLAKNLEVYIVGGSFPERCSINSNVMYNATPVFAPDGTLIAKHRKLHLFDTDIPGAVTFNESSILTPGDEMTTFDAFGMKFGLGIWHDSRFIELASAYRKIGCDVLIYPSVFHESLGKNMWELVFRGRAHDNQVYVAAVSPAMNSKAKYTAWGHSMIADPWGKIIAQAEEHPDIVYTTIDPSVIRNARLMFPY